jgi:hypothetical protein
LHFLRHPNWIEENLMKNSRPSCVAGVCLALAAQVCFAQTVAVGTCRPRLTSYSSIGAAVAAVPSGATVLVCSGIYPESPAITTPLTLRGLTTVPGTRMVYVQGITAQASSGFPIGSVNIDNVAVAGTGGPGSGSIQYNYAGGTVENVDLSGEIAANENVIFTDAFPLTIKNSSIHDFTGTGISTTGGAISGYSVNLVSNWISSAPGATNATGVSLEGATALIDGNTIVMNGGTSTGLSFPLAMSQSGELRDNTIIGAGAGISVGSHFNGQYVISGNVMFNNGTGISDGAEYSSNHDVISSNEIAQSSVEAISVACTPFNGSTTVENNKIINAPVGIAYVYSLDVVAGNQFYGVMTPTAACPGSAP